MCYSLSKTRIWISSIGFSLFFGPILAKAFRVYYIFRSVKLKKKVVAIHKYIIISCCILHTPLAHKGLDLAAGGESHGGH